MVKSTNITVYLCSECGSDYPKWHGKCPTCNEWGTLKEFSISKKDRQKRDVETRPTIPLVDILYHGEIKRNPTGISEIDRVLGGGFLPGSVVLLGGNPGIGKSTLALQMVAKLKDPVLYVSAEENEEQIALRSKRLGINSNNLNLTSENRWEGIMEHLSLLNLKYLVIDSIQTIYTDHGESLPGSIGQVRECGQKILEICKQRRLTGIIIGHVTKEGMIAGPKMLEHMVDTVLYLEGDTRHDYRILRAVKNRFGSTNEIGVFEMTTRGLQEVKNPSELFLAERHPDIAGSVVVPTMEGSRPILIEVQALVSNATFGNPQRNVTGFAPRRLSMLLAVLEKRLGLLMSTKDVFVNFVGGMSVNEPAVDLAVISAIASSQRDKPLPSRMVLAGEVGLGGELRAVSHIEKRVQEAKRLGFKEFIGPASNVNKMRRKVSGITLIGVESVESVFKRLF